MCSDGAQMGNISIIEQPKNGTVSILDQATGAPCANKAMRVVMYKPNPGFKGADRIGYTISYVPRGYESFARTINVR